MQTLELAPGLVWRGGRFECIGVTGRYKCMCTVDVRCILYLSLPRYIIWENRMRVAMILVVCIPFRTSPI